MFDILFAYIFSIYGNEYGCKMIKKIDILGIQLDNYTVREAIMRVEAWYDNNMLNVIEMVSMQMLTESESDPVLKEVISSLDLAVIGRRRGTQWAVPSGCRSSGTIPCAPLCGTPSARCTLCT